MVAVVCCVGVMIHDSAQLARLMIDDASTRFGSAPLTRRKINKKYITSFLPRQRAGDFSSSSLQHDRLERAYAAHPDGLLWRSRSCETCIA